MAKPNNKQKKSLPKQVCGSAKKRKRVQLWKCDNDKPRVVTRLSKHRNKQLRTRTWPSSSDYVHLSL